MATGSMEPTADAPTWPAGRSLVARAMETKLVLQGVLIDLRERAQNQHRGRFLLDGTLRGRAPLALHFSGHEKRMQELVLFLFDGTAQIEANAPAPEHAVRVSEAWPWQVSAPDSLVVQPWLEAKSSPGCSYEVFFHERLNHTMRYTIKKAKEHGFALVTTRDERDIDTFYNQYMAPMVKNRFGAATTMGGYAAFKRWNGRTSHIEVIYVENNNAEAHARRIAGAAIVLSPLRRELRVYGYGAIPEVIADKRLRAEFTPLLNDAIFARACDLGFEINIGLTRPFLDDGVMSFKRRWGCRFEPVNAFSRFRFHLGGPAKVQLLREAPLFYLRRGGLGAAIAVRDASEPELKLLRERLQAALQPGVERVDVIVGGRGADLDAVRAAVPEALREMTRVGDSEMRVGD